MQKYHKQGETIKGNVKAGISCSGDRRINVSMHELAWPPVSPHFLPSPGSSHSGLLDISEHTRHTSFIGLCSGCPSSWNILLRSTCMICSSHQVLLKCHFLSEGHLRLKYTVSHLVLHFLIFCNTKQLTFIVYSFILQITCKPHVCRNFLGCMQSNKKGMLSNVSHVPGT